MGLDASSLLEVEKAKSERKTLLKKAMSKPFDINDPEQLKFLKAEVNAFECNANLMHLLDGFRNGWKLGFNDGWKVWGVGTVAKFVLNNTIGCPQIFSFFGYSVLLTSMIAHVFEKCKINDFYDQVEEMKIIYKWVFNKVEDNSDRLAEPDVQRMTKLLAPLCEVSFMVRWPAIATNTQLPSFWSSMASYASSAASRFVGEKAATIDQAQINQLKTDVEINAFKLGSLKGIKQACEYFATSQEFRDMVAEIIPKPVKGITHTLIEATFKK